MHHFNGGVHVAERQADQRTCHPFVGVGECVGIGACETTGRHALKRNFFCVGCIDDALQQVVLDSRSIGYTGSLACRDIAVVDLVHHRGVRAVRYICDNRDIWADAFGNHLCSAQANFFLHGIGDVQAKRKLGAFLVEEASDFSDHESSGAVVQRTGNVPVLV